MSVDLHHVAQGPHDAPAVLLGGALGTNLELFDDLAARLSGSLRVVRFDTRGHGRSPVPEGPYTMAGLAGDVLALADRLGLPRFSYLGLSIGGAVGLTLALQRPDRLDRLVLACTGARFGTPEAWQERAEVVTREGMQALVEPTTQRWFTEEFRRARPDVVEQVMGSFAAQDPRGYAGCCLANAGYDVTARLAEVAAPTRVVVASEDASAPPAQGEAMAAAIPEADLVRIDGAAHLAHLARPDRFAAAVAEHLTGGL